MDAAESRFLALLLAALGAVAPAQEPGPRQDPVARAQRAVRELLLSDDLSEALLERAVQATLEGGRPAFAHLGEVLREAAAEPEDPARIERLEALGTHLTVQLVQRESERDLVYAGQYEVLRELQPLSGRLLLKLMLDPPGWFPDTHRKLLVPALRDVFPEGPGKEAVRDMAAIAENVEYEPGDLRRLLSYALYQWGRPDFVQPEIDRFSKAVEEGDEEDRLAAQRQLAEVYYQLREYRRAAAVHREFLRGAESYGLRLTPVDYYNAACNYNLSGNPDEALAALEKCAEMQASDSVDSSLKLERELFEKDPEIAVLRSTERFKKLMRKAFGGGG